MADQFRWDRSIGAERQQLVTASALVRQFGTWQDRAAKAPVYILHRGRPRLVLMSIDLMEALCLPRDDIAARQAGADALMEAMRELVVIVDELFVVTRLSRAASSYFGVPPTGSVPLAELAPGPATAFLVETTRRVIAGGFAETIEIAALGRAGRLFSIEVMPWGTGAALFATDVTTADDLRDAAAHVQAIDQALAVVDGAATARINLRGYLEQPSPSLAALTGIATETLASVRFVTLLDVASRVEVAEAIEAVIADGSPCGLTARMPVNRGGTRAIRIGLSLLRRRAVAAGVAAILIGDLTATG